jgi:putative nucleotidyltransferase with HDIG domain
MRSSSNLFDAFFWEKLVLVAILSAPLFFYRFTISLTGAKQQKRILYPLYFLYVAFLGLIPTGLVVSGMQMMWYGKAPIIGPLFFPYTLCVYAPIVLGLRVLMKHRRESRILNERIRDSYVIAGIIVMLIGGTTDYLPPLGISMYPLGIIGNIVFCLLATIAMLKYGLLEMKVVLRKGAAYSLVSMATLGIFAILIFLLSSVFQELINPISIGITIITVFATAAAFQPILSRLQRQVDRWFFRERYDNLQALKRFAKETRNMMDLKQLSSSLVSTIAQGMLSRGVYLLLPSPRTGAFVTYTYSGEKHNGRLHFPVNSLLTLTMKFSDSLIDCNDIDVIPSLSGLPDNDRQLLARNQIELLLPLKTEERLVGILLIGNKLSGEPYSTEDRRLLQTVSSEVAISIENAGRYENVQREHEELQQTMEGIIHAMSLTVETRDPYTAGHQRRVAELASAIAKEMGLSEWHVEGMRITGLLHDVGKLVVPAEILSKPGPINQYEFSIIKTHSEVGYEILKGIAFPWPVTQAILQHHERLDGSGYPKGLPGKDIILEARILGVSDVVEAMSSHRPYRPALGLDSALKEILKERGVLYDAEVVDACLRLSQRNELEFKELVKV